MYGLISFVLYYFNVLKPTQVEITVLCWTSDHHQHSFSSVTCYIILLYIYIFSSFAFYDYAGLLFFGIDTIKWVLREWSDGLSGINAVIIIILLRFNNGFSMRSVKNNKKET